MDDFVNNFNNDFQETLNEFQESTQNTSYSVLKFIKPDARFESGDKDYTGTFYLKPLKEVMAKLLVTHLEEYYYLLFLVLLLSLLKLMVFNMNSHQFLE